MDFKKYINDWAQFKFDKNSRLLLLVIYAVIMISSISSQINTFVFIILFAILPISIYTFVKYIFPKE